MRIPKQTPAIFHDCRGYSFVGWASNSGLPTRYLRDPGEDLIQRIVTAVRTIPCQEEIYVQAGILQLGGESNRYREGRVSVAGAVSHIRQASYSIGEYLFTPESATLLHQPTSFPSGAMTTSSTPAASRYLSPASVTASPAIPASGS